MHINLSVLSRNVCHVQDNVGLSNKCMCRINNISYAVDISEYQSYFNMANQVRF